MKETTQAAEAPTTRCPSPQWGEGEGVGLEGRGVGAVEADGDAAAREIDDHGNFTGRKGAVRKDAHRKVPPAGGG